MLGEEVVVDLCGKSARETDGPSAVPYSRGTIQAVFSSGKNLEVLIVALLVDRGLARYANPINVHWHKFGWNGKIGITIADLMRHSAGMA